MQFMDKLSLWFSNVLAAFSTGALAVLKAVLILAIAFLAAWIVKSIVVKILGKGKLGDAMTKMDGDKPGSTKKFIGKFVSLLIFILFVPGIFECLGLQSVMSPITQVFDAMWGYVPNIVGAIIVLVIGFFIARVVRQLLVPLFDKIQINKLQEKLGIEVTDSGKLSNTLAYVVYVLILLPMIKLLIAFSALDFTVRPITLPLPLSKPLTRVANPLSAPTSTAVLTPTTGLERLVFAPISP